MSKALTEHQMMERVSARFSSEKGWATFRGIRNHRGFSPPKGQKTRTLDGMSVGLWRSHRAEVLGFECKSSRGDLLKELNGTAKSDAFMPYCNRFWLVVGDAKICSPDEIPMGWGLLAPHGKSLREVVKAKRNKDAEPMPQGIVLSLLHSAQQQAEKESDEIRRSVTAEVQERLEDGSELESRTVDLNLKIQSMQRTIDAHERRFTACEKQRDDLLEVAKAVGAPGFDIEGLKMAYQLHRRMSGWGPDSIKGMEMTAERMVAAAKGLSEMTEMMKGEQAE